MKPASRTLDQMQIRLPDGMRDKLAQTASLNRRSMNAEVIAAIAAHLGIDTPAEPAAAARPGINWLELTAPITLQDGAAFIGRDLGYLLSFEKDVLFAVVHQLRRDFADAAKVAANG